MAVARAFDELKAEGLINSSWGSETILQPRSVNRKLEFRGVVAEIVSAGSFAEQPRCRALVRNVCTQLWQHGFSSRLWLYEPAEAREPSFCQQVIAEKPDSIVWLMPTPRMSELAYRLMNCGIRVIRATAVAEIVDQLLS